MGDSRNWGNVRAALAGYDWRKPPHPFDVTARKVLAELDTIGGINALPDAPADIARPLAELVLADWAAHRDQRDQLVQAALRAGLTKNRIYTLTRVARTTIDRLLERRQHLGGTECDPSALQP